MGRFVSGETKTVAAPWWEEGEEVVIRRWNTVQLDVLNEAILKIAGISGTLSAIEIRAVNVPVLMAGIESWTFREGDKKVPVSRKWIGKLAPEDSSFISTEIWAFNRGRPAEEQASFRKEH